MSTKFDGYSPSALVSLLIKREEELKEFDRLRDEILNDVSTIKNRLIPLFAVGFPKHYHSVDSGEILVVHRTFAGFSVEKVELASLHDLKFPEPPATDGPPGAAVPVMGEAVTDDDGGGDHIF